MSSLLLNELYSKDEYYIRFIEPHILCDKKNEIYFNMRYIYKKIIVRHFLLSLKTRLNFYMINVQNVYYLN